MATIFSQIGDVIGKEISNLKASINGMFSKDSSTGDITFTGNLIPSENEVFSLGSVDKRLKDVFISANTIHLGTSTFHGTSIAVDAGENPTSLADIPTVIASKMVAKPFSYVSGSTTVTVRPTIEFQDAGGVSYPISFDTANNKFSFDAQGNYGQGIVVAKDYEFTGEIRASAVTINNLQTHIENNLRVDGTVNLGYDETGTTYMKNTTEFRAPVLFKEGATLGDGNDTITVNAGGANDFVITARKALVNGVDVVDKYTKTEVDTKIAAATPTFASLTGKPTTIAGYGITDALSKTEKAADSDKLDGLDSTAFIRYYEQSAAPTTATSGSLWKDTDTNIVYMASNESGVTTWFAI